MQVTRSSKIISGLALAGALLLAGIVGFAQQPTTPGQGRGGDRQGRMGRDGGGFEGGGLFESLNLTDAQKQQMQQISARYHETFKAMHKQGRGGERGGESSIFNGGTFDEAAVRAAAQARANAQVEMEVARAHM